MFRASYARLVRGCGRTGANFFTATAPRPRIPSAKFSGRSRFASVTLQASSVGAVIVALAQPELHTRLPADTEDAIGQAWRKTIEAGSLGSARELAWEAARVWMAHYFAGEFEDEGPLGDVLSFRGVYLAAEDTRLFYLPPGGEAHTPVLCVCLNQRWPWSLEDFSALSWEELSQDEHKYFPVKVETDLLWAVGQRLEKWQDERGFERCLVVIRWENITGIYVYEDGMWHAWDWQDVISEEQITS